MNQDKIEKLGNSVIQHGKYNDRIYLMKIDNKDAEMLLSKVDKLSSLNNYSKIFAKVPYTLKDTFEKNNYIIEAEIPDFYNGAEDVLFMAKFIDENRKIITDSMDLDSIVLLANQKKLNDDLQLPIGYKLREMDVNDSRDISSFYRSMFQSYPFPIYNEKYILKTIQENVRYFAITKNLRIVAISSMEIDKDYKNVEMTDFATSPLYRGKGFAALLLAKMEIIMKEEKYKTAYSIARAKSKGMNFVFGSRGYIFGGRLVNNTQISGGIESMNIWYKHF